MKPKLLLVDEEENFRAALARRLEASGFVVITAAGVEEALELVSSDAADVVILGIPGQGHEYLRLLTQIRRVRPQTQVIVLAAQGSVELAMQAMKLGALDCLQKPTNFGELLEKIKEAEKKQAGRSK